MNRGNEMLSFDEMKGNGKNGNMSQDDLKNIRKCFIFLGFFVLAIVILWAVFL